jgi:hypothetical protein
LYGICQVVRVATIPSRAPFRRAWFKAHERLENTARGAIPKKSRRVARALHLPPASNSNPNARRRPVTATLNPTCDKTQTPLTRDEVRRMLRDAAYVLHLTRRVKAEIVAERAEAARSTAAPRRPEMAAGLGV